MGNTIFDAIAGEPGTYVSFDSYGNLTWGFSIEKWFADWAAIEAERAASDPRNTSEVEAQCQQRVIEAVNTAFGASTVSANNLVGSFFFSGAWNFNFSVTGDAASQVTQTRFNLTSSGPSGPSVHVPSSYFWDPFHVWQPEPDQLTFTAHIDAGNGGSFPGGTFLHFAKDVLGSGSRNPCPN